MSAGLVPSASSPWPSSPCVLPTKSSLCVSVSWLPLLIRTPAMTDPPTGPHFTLITFVQTLSPNTVTFWGTGLTSTYTWGTQLSPQHSPASAPVRHPGVAAPASTRCLAVSPSGAGGAAAPPHSLLLPASAVALSLGALSWGNSSLWSSEPSNWIPFPAGTLMRCYSGTSFAHPQHLSYSMATADPLSIFPSKLQVPQG